LILTWFQVISTSNGLKNYCIGKLERIFILKSLIEKISFVFICFTDLDSELQNCRWVHLKGKVRKKNKILIAFPLSFDHFWGSFKNSRKKLLSSWVFEMKPQGKIAMELYQSTPTVVAIAARHSWRSLIKWSDLETP
jgi:hypothetical protein